MRSKIVRRIGAATSAACLLHATPGSAALVSLYRFDETSGTTAEDAVRGNAGTATIFGGARFDTGQIGRALRFDGINDFGYALNALPTGTTNFSISTWVYVDSVVQFTTFTKNWGDSNPGAFHLGLDADSDQGKVSNYVYDGSKIVSPNTLTLHDWQQVAVTFDGSTKTQKLYINGQPVATGTTSVMSLAALGTNMSMGAKTKDNTTEASQGNAGYLNGMLDDLAYYNETLGDSAINTIYTNGSQGIGIQTEPAPEPGCLTAVAVAAPWLMRRRRVIR